MNRSTTTSWELAHRRRVALGAGAVVMGVLNVTPDSFSDGGRFLGRDAALAQAARLAAEGAGIVDVGGESTRPGARPVTAAEEQDRVLPVIEAIAREIDVAISIDTCRAATAGMAVAAGAHIVNDVWSLQRDPGIAAAIAASGAGVVVMHNSRDRDTDPDPVADQRLFLGRSLALAASAGIGREKIVLDPGFGFGKERTEDNVALMARFGELHGFGLPLLVGTSRKRFLGHLTGREAGGRDIATAATSAILRLAGAAVFRVHDVAASIDALRVADAVLAFRRAHGKRSGACT